MCKLQTKIVFIFIFILSCGFSAFSQTVLPEVSATNEQGKNELNWISGYTNIKSIGVQRSRDSLSGYATIGYVADPNEKVNSYIDNKPLTGGNFYRLFILFSNNSYVFTNPAKIVLIPSTVQGKTEGPYSFQPSIFVYTNPDGNVNISLADAKQEDYTIRFFDAENKFLFTVKDINESFLVLAKSNFLRTGWYHYELYENGKIKEKWKFHIGDKADK